jgi:hypothetical protein
MTYRTTKSPQELAPILEGLGFTYLETSCSCTTYHRNGDLISIEEPDAVIFEDLEIATDFRLAAHEIVALGAWHI